MAFFGNLGIDYILFSKIIGILSGLFIIGLSFFWGRRFLGKNNLDFLALSIPLLLAANGTFAYWAVSGLETLLFSALIFYGLFLAAENKILFVPILALATLTRPEGGLVFVLVLIYFLITRTHAFREILKYLIIFAMLIAPQILFRLYYYHDIFPNPFYAKTGLSAGYLQAGVDYIGLFFSRYGFYGLIILIPLIGFRLLPRGLRLLLFVDILYMLYIISVGGDVLHEHRFFVPLLAILYLPFVSAIAALLQKLFMQRERLIYIFAGLVLWAACRDLFCPPVGNQSQSGGRNGAGRQNANRRRDAKSGGQLVILSGLFHYRVDRIFQQGHNY